MSRARRLGLRDLGLTTVARALRRAAVHPMLATIAAIAMIAGVTACSDGTGTYDTVLSGGRVMDPESGLDAVRDVGIRGGKVEAVSEETLTGERVIDVAGLVVAPGFVDLHQHGQSDETYRFMAHDGVTTGLELEVGSGDIAAFYGEREGGQVVNYGASIGHIPVRMAVMGDGGAFLPADAREDRSREPGADRCDRGRNPPRARPRRSGRRVRLPVHTGGERGGAGDRVPRCRRVWCVGPRPHARGPGRRALRARARSEGGGAAPHRARELDGWSENGRVPRGAPGSHRHRAGRHDRSVPVRGRPKPDRVRAVRRLGGVGRRALRCFPVGSHGGAAHSGDLCEVPRGGGQRHQPRAHPRR